jgi:hypothetical protein
VTDRPYEHFEEQQLVDFWIAAFKSLATDYASREALAKVELLADEFRARGLSAPTSRVAPEIASIAQQMRAAEIEQAPPVIDAVQRGLEQNLMSFVAELNTSQKHAPEK